MAMARFRRAALAISMPAVLGMTALLTACGGDTGPTGQRGTTGVAGANGMTALVQVLAETPGANCSAGGSKIVAGLDANADGVLQSSEITSTQYVCNAAPGLVGAAGATGAAGSDGLSTLVAISGEPAGANCANGGKRLDAGKDANADGDYPADQQKRTRESSETGTPAPTLRRWRVGRGRVARLRPRHDYAKAGYARPPHIAQCGPFPLSSAEGATRVA